MSANVIDGRAFAQKILEEVRLEGDAFRQQHAICPTLAVILVGNNPASEVYVNNKHKKALEVGFQSEIIRLPETVTTEAVLREIERLNADRSVHGILLQLPLPPQVNPLLLLNAIDPDKDVDGFHPYNIGRLWTGQVAPYPCTPLGCSLILKDHLGDLSGKHAVVVGRSDIVGKPMAALLLAANATVTVAHSRTQNLPELCRQADILVAAVGRPRLIQGAWLKSGVVVLDVGINRIQGEDGKNKLCGDVDFDTACEVAGAITPVPGGIGPITIACLLRNTLTCAQALALKGC